MFATSLQGPRILIVDDDLGTLEILAVALSRQGYQVKTASTVADAMVALEVTPPRLVFCDLRLPDGDGLQVLTRLNSLSPPRAFVLMTGYATVPTVIDALRLGANDCFEKPIDIAWIIEAAARCVPPEKIAQWPARRPVFSEARTDGRQPLEPNAERAARIVLVLTGILDSQSDVHSISELCRVAPIGVSASTFRRWCFEERVVAVQALRLARLLRASVLAERYATSPTEWLDADPRTLKALLLRAGGSTEILDRGCSVNQFIRQQRLVTNPTVLRVLERSLSDSDGSDSARPIHASDLRRDRHG